jgi:CBS domain-containing protein
MPDEHEHTELIDQPVTTIMSHPVYTVVEDLDLAQVLTAMVRTGRRHLAAVDSAGRCLGVIGDRAVAAAWADNPAAMAYRHVQHLLDPRQAVVGSDATVGDVARLMHLDHVDAVAVIDRTGCPVGMVTGGDLIALMARAVHSNAPPVAPDQPR